MVKLRQICELLTWGLLRMRDPADGNTIVVRGPVQTTLTGLDRELLSSQPTLRSNSSA
jgi:hypothetical protein